jgi:HAD superfamily hydrolase (TIGR01549 family)
MIDMVNYWLIEVYDDDTVNVSVTSEEEVEALLDFHKKNGGLSRYVKFRYFLEEIRKEEADSERMEKLSEGFSEIMRELLTDKKRLIEEVVEFIKDNHRKYNMHIVSGSDGDELRYLCSKLEISAWFKSIYGSPTPKIELVSRVLKENGYLQEETCLIGDAINDFEAAEKNGIAFFGYNNPDLKEKGQAYLESFE